MKSTTRLDSVVFQLTPTRTRCDLLITANGKTKKIASGLLNPFLAHLKAAQEQIGKGGYSIILEPDSDGDGSWFTKGTVERFVRFVSTPEILERVYTIESEILQIDEAISFQNNNAAGSHTQLQDHQTKYEEINEGGKTVIGSHEDKAIVLYKGDVNPRDTEGSVDVENSRDQLLRVLETRKTVLQKEQGMAFARAVAAGFDIDHIGPLMSFADCFGASRMKDACSRFFHLWKAKHESGQWLEIEAAEAKSVFSPVNASGITLSSSFEKQKESRELWPEDGLASEDQELSNRTTIPDNRLQSDHPVLPHPHEYPSGHFSHPMFPSWPIHPQAGALPTYQQYPMHMPFYQNYPGSSPFFQPPCPSMDESTSYTGQRMGLGGNSIEIRGLSNESENRALDASKRRVQDELATEEADSQVGGGRKNHGKSVRKKSGMVVIRNINYITSKKQNSSGNESISDSDTEGDGNFKTSSPNSSRHVQDLKSVDAFMTFSNEERRSGRSRDGGQWQAFQNILLRDADEDDKSSKGGMFAAEGKGIGRKQQSAADEDPSVPGGREVGGVRNNIYNGFHDITGDLSPMPKPTYDEMLTSTGGDIVHSISSIGARMDAEIAGMSSQRDGYKRTSTAGEDLMIHGQDNITDLSNNALNPLIGNGLDTRCNQNNSWSHDTTDDSFIIPRRTSVLDEGGIEERTAIDVDSEVPSVPPGAGKHAEGTVAQYNYEPNDLNLMPDRITNSGLVGYDPALEYQLHAHLEGSNKTNDKKEIAKDSKQGSRKVVKDPRSTGNKKITSGASKGPVKTSKLSPSGEARARADKLRSFKADLQKLKKAQEEEQSKRIEALKVERQKRIAARSKANPDKALLPTLQTRKQQSAKLSPSSHKGSKFSDTEPGPPSPLQRSTIKSTSKRSLSSHEAPKSGRLKNQLVGSKVSRSASSLFEDKDESADVTPESKATMARIKRLSEPKTMKFPASAVSQGREPILRQRISDGPNMKKTSSMMNLDKTKSATLSELKLQTSKVHSEVAHRKSSTKEQKLKGNKHSNVSARPNPHEGIQSDEDESTVVEKTVVMLECGKPSIPVADNSKEKIGIQNVTLYGDYTNGNIKQLQAIGSHDSLYNRKEGKEKSVLDQVGTAHMAEGLLKEPHARLSSLEDPCTTKSEYGKAPPTSLEIRTDTIEPPVVHVLDSQQEKMDNTSESSGLPLGKESSKGLKGLLKFGRRNHMSVTVESSVKSDKLHLEGSRIDDNPTSAGFAGEVNMLKTLLSQPETNSTGNSSKKSSRPFSLFAPFRSKTGEKKLSW